MYISGAKFEELCSNVSGDILDWVLHRFSGTTYDISSFAKYKNVYISKKKKDIPKMKTPFFFTLKSHSNKKLLFFTS